MPPSSTARGVLQKGAVLVLNPEEANALHQRGCYGKMMSGGRLQLAPVEALYLVQNGRLEVFDSKGKSFDFDELARRFSKIDPDLKLKLAVYSDLRSRGFIVKTGLKFGTHFRVYDRGERPGKAHSKFLVHAVPESAKVGMVEIARAVRLAHGVRKRFLWAVVDEEGDVTYYAVTWERL